MGWPLERVERYAGPPLAERANVAALAAAVELRRTGEPVSLADSIERVLGSGDDVDWDARRRPEDGRWVVVVSVKGKPAAAWTYDTAGRNVHPLDEEARRLMGVAPAREPAPESSRTATRETAVITRPAHPSLRGEQREQHRETERHERPHLVSVPAPEPETAEPTSQTADADELADVVDFGERELVGRDARPSQHALDAEDMHADGAHLDETYPDDVYPDDDGYADDAGYATDTDDDDPLADLPPAAGQQETLNLPRPAPVPAKPVEPVAPVAETPTKPARKPKPKPKRASVPTWDEILFGSKTPED